jgi:hypothetical protein
VELESRVNDKRNSTSVIDHKSYLPTAPATSISGVSEGVGVVPSSVLYTQPEPSYHNAQNRFPCIAFLDSEAFKYGGVLVANPSIDIPPVSHSTCSTAG